MSSEVKNDNTQSTDSVKVEKETQLSDKKLEKKKPNQEIFEITKRAAEAGYGLSYGKFVQDNKL